MEMTGYLPEEYRGIPNPLSVDCRNKAAILAESVRLLEKKRKETANEIEEMYRQFLHENHMDELVCLRAFPRVHGRLKIMTLTGSLIPEIRFVEEGRESGWGKTGAPTCATAKAGAFKDIMNEILVNYQPYENGMENEAAAV